MNFRKDINGLRAIAVAAVLLYHFGVPPFSGGFVGVDIFFVISGYLLTSIAYRDLQRDMFSVRTFLIKRVRRIYPALVVVVFASIAWAGYSYLPGDYKHFVRIATTALVFRSNFAFAGDTGYFAPDAKLNLMLHTWSLSVETQFYLVFAILCGVFWPRASRPRREIGTAIFFGIMLASLIWCLLRTQSHPVPSFYLLWARAWEFMAGSTAAVYGRVSRSEMTNNVISAIGLLMLAVCIVGIDAHQPYPGWRALLPVVGATLLILGEGSALSRLLCTTPFQFLGTISYSVYLWHWPVLLAFREFAGVDPSALQTVVLITVSLFAGWLSYRFVESPTRQGVPTKLLLGGAVACIAIAFGFLSLLSWTDGLPQRLPAYLQPALQATYNAFPLDDKCMRAMDGSKQTKEPGDFCTIGAPGVAPTMMLWGDSFANRLQPRVSEAAAQIGLAGIVATEGGCPPFKGKVFKGSGAEVFPDCERYANFVFDYFERTPQISLVVIAGDWQRYEPEYEGQVIRNIASILAQRGGHLIFVSAVPSPKADVPKVWARKQIQAGHAISEWTIPRTRETEIVARGDRIAAIASQVGNVIVVDPFASLCSGSDCFIVKNGRALYMDTDHLSDAGRDYLTPDILGALKRSQSKSPVQVPDKASQNVKSLDLGVATNGA